MSERPRYIEPEEGQDRDGHLRPVLDRHPDDEEEGDGLQRREDG